MHDQSKQLYKVINDCCTSSRNMKLARKMLPDVDEFGLYLTLAFDHFSESLDIPFDYVEASLKHQPPPTTLSESLMAFARLVAREVHIDDIATLFTRLTPFIASCLLLDAARKRRIGKLTRCSECIPV